MTEPIQNSWQEAFKHADGPTLYLMHGLLGSGKSTWARKFLAVHPRCKIVSADGFREMINGKYKYEAEADDAITASMVGAIQSFQKAGYDVVVDCGNLTKDRRKPFILASADTSVLVAIRLPQESKEWHLRRRLSRPHWDTNWSEVYDGEKATITALDAEAEGIDAIVDVPVSDVEGKRILILSASPSRDKHIDNLIAGKLRGMGHDVEVTPCLRGGRDAVLRYHPDICLIPPIRNPHSRDFAEEMHRFGCAVVTRHTEPSCSWQDWKRMDVASKTQILGAYGYQVDMELVWGSDEADILHRRPGSPEVFAVGAIGLDIYFDEALKAALSDKPKFLAQHGFGGSKPVLLITSPWGFADMSPDLNTDDMTNARADREGLKRHLDMVRTVHAQLKEDWHILLSIHAGVGAAPYQALAKELGVPLDIEAAMLDMLPNCNAVVHAGSTCAISAHLLGIPTFQFGDVNAAGSTSWWGEGESPISRVAPRFTDIDGLVPAIRHTAIASNANVDVIKELEEGRYGVIDGHAADRAIEHITSLSGHFRYRWPRSRHDYRQLGVQREEDDLFKKGYCNVCQEEVLIVEPKYLRAMAVACGKPPETLLPVKGINCPWCAARFMPTT